MRVPLRSREMDRWQQRDTFCAISDNISSDQVLPNGIMEWLKQA